MVVERRDRERRPVDAAIRPDERKEHVGVQLEPAPVVIEEDEQLFVLGGALVEEERKERGGARSPAPRMEEEGREDQRGITGRGRAVARNEEGRAATHRRVGSFFFVRRRRGRLDLFLLFFFGVAAGARRGPVIRRRRIAPTRLRVAFARVPVPVPFEQHRFVRVGVRIVVRVGVRIVVGARACGWRRTGVRVPASSGLGPHGPGRREHRERAGEREPRDRAPQRVPRA